MEEEFRRVKKIVDPKTPTKSEKEDHELAGHLPFRSWCEHCIRGKGHEAGHYKTKEKKDALPEVHVDYAFIGGGGGVGKEEAGNLEKQDKELIPMLVIKEKDTRMLMACVVPMKGTTGMFAAQKVMEFLKEVGLDGMDLIIKTDQESALLAMIADVREMRTGAKTITETSPVRSPQSNGFIERGVMTVKEQLKVMKSALEARWKRKIIDQENVMTWMADYAGMLLNRREVAKDGKTAYERLKGKRGFVPGVEFGEKVMWKKPAGSKNVQALDSLWDVGVFVGLKTLSGEFIVATKNGIHMARTVRRKTEEERWNIKDDGVIFGVPWNKGPEDTDADGVRPKEMDFARNTEGAEDNEKVWLKPSEQEPVPRRVVLAKEDFKKHGYTPGCRACKESLAGKGVKHLHTDDCRRRMEKAMADNLKVKGAKRRIDDYISKIVEKDARMRMTETEARGGMKEDAKVNKRRAEGDLMGEPENKVRVVEEEGGVKRDRDGDDIDADEKRTRVNGLMMKMPINDEFDEDAWVAWDDLKMTEMDPGKVKEARDEEMKFLKKEKVYEKCDIKDCINKTGRSPTSVRWVDVNKGTEEKPNYRSRLVARDFKVKGDDRENIFAAMPPLEAKAILMAAAACRWRRWQAGKEKDLWKLLFVDVKKAHTYAKCDDEDAFVELPEEDWEEGRCGKLRRWLYGMRGAAQGWERDYQMKMSGVGFVVGKSAPTVFAHSDRELRCVVHGDDFTFVGKVEDLKWISDKMQEWYEVKIRGVVGPEAGDVKSIDILNRKVTWSQEGIVVEADEKHAQEIMKEMGLSMGSNGIGVPGKRREAKESEEELNIAETRRFGGLAARANYLAQDRPDIQFAARELCRNMAVPKMDDWDNMKRLGRYLVKNPAMQIIIEGTVEEMMVEVYADSDWAGCVRTRRSTSGGLVVVGGGCVKSWSSTQATVAMSSGEAELFGVVRGAAEGLGVQAIMADMKMKAVVKVRTDSTAAKAMTWRRGVGRTRHLDVKFLWVQAAVSEGKITIEKVKGKENPAGVLAKYIIDHDMEKVMRDYGIKLKREAIVKKKKRWADMTEDEDELQENP